MSDGSEIFRLIEAYGLIALVPLSLLEGPIVTVLAGWLVSLSLLDPLVAFIVLVLGDVVGDVALYAAGRGVRLDRIPWVGGYFRIPRAQLVRFVRMVRHNGVRLLVIGKLTQAAGFAVLIAAGTARMNLPLFIAVNLLASIPKTLALMILGYFLGEAHERVARWLSFGSYAFLAALLVGGGLFWLYRRKRNRCPDT